MNIYIYISSSPGFSTVVKMLQMTVRFRPQRATDGLARSQKVWSRKKTNKRMHLIIHEDSCWVSCSPFSSELRSAEEGSGG